jgi:hypothetical protein
MDKVQLEIGLDFFTKQTNFNHTNYLVSSKSE